ncbi:MAG: hypothetical protein ACI9WU_003151 [Myxococcota bacterium]
MVRGLLTLILVIAGCSSQDPAGLPDLPVLSGLQAAVGCVVCISDFDAPAQGAFGLSFAAAQNLPIEHGNQGGIHITPGFTSDLPSQLVVVVGEANAPCDGPVVAQFGPTKLKLDDSGSAASLRVIFDQPNPYLYQGECCVALQVTDPTTDRVATVGGRFKCTYGASWE